MRVGCIIRYRRRACLHLDLVYDSSPTPLPSHLPPNDNLKHFSVNSTAVVELVFACLRSPRVWLGHDANRPRHARPDNILGLSEEQARSLAEYVVDELGRGWDGADERAGGSERSTVKRRVDLLIEAAANVTLAPIVQRWSQLAEIPDYPHKQAARALLLEMRFRRPMLIRQSDVIEKLSSEGYTEVSWLSYFFSRFLGRTRFNSIIILDRRADLSLVERFVRRSRIAEHLADDRNAQRRLAPTRQLVPDFGLSVSSTYFCSLLIPFLLTKY